MLSSSRVALLLGLLIALSPVSRAAAQACAPQLCASASGNCEVTSTCTLTVGATDMLFDLGTRAFIVKANKTLTIDGTGGITVYAGSILLESGAKIVATGGPGNAGASVTLEANGSITLSASTLIDVSSQFGGGLVGLRAGGAIQALGKIKASSAGGVGSGGNVDIDTFLDNGTDITIGGAGIDTSSGPIDAGGFVDINAGAKVTISALIDTSGGDGDGGDVTVAASGGDILLVANQGSINTTATKQPGSITGGGWGGDVDLDASGALTVGGPILGNGAGGGGNGASISLTGEGGGVTMNGRVEAAGGTGGGWGGDISISAAGMISVGSPISANGAGTQASGGTVDFQTTGNLALFSSVDVDGGWGGSITAEIDGSINVATTLSATGTSGGAGGSIDLQGCGITVQNAAVLNSSGPGTFPSASNQLEASGTMSVAGTLTAGATSRNVLSYRSQLPTWNPAKITPALGPNDVVQNTFLPCCVGCPVTTTTTTSTSTTITTTTSSTVSTTSTSSTTTSSTSSTSTSSTTSTTIVPSTTTTSVTVATTSTTSTTTTSTTVTSTSTTSTSTLATTTTTQVTTTTSTTEATTTSTTVATTTTTTVLPTTTSTTVVPATTSTSTTLPLTCLDMPLDGFEAVDCRLGTLADTLDSEAPTSLGGTKTAKQLKVKVAKARKLVTTARGAKKPSVVLKRADRQLHSFDKVIDKMASKGKVTSELHDRLLGLSQSTSAQIGALRATPAS